MDLKLHKTATISKSPQNPNERTHVGYMDYKCAVEEEEDEEEERKKKGYNRRIISLKIEDIGLEVGRRRNRRRI